MSSPQIENIGRYAVGALFGSLVSALAVVMAGHAPALLVVFGFFLATFLYGWLAKAIGRVRIVKWLSYADAVAGGKELSSVGSMNRFPGGRQHQAVSARERGKLACRVRTLRGAPTYNQPKATVLPPVAQDVISALVNLGTPFNKANEIVSLEQKPGDSFDDLFRRSVDVLNRGKVLSRRVA